MFDYTAKQEFAVNVITSSGQILEGVKVYAFDEDNSYTNLNQVTDDQGRAYFDRENFGRKPYSFRVDYLSAQFWSDSIVVQSHNNISVVIEEENVEMTVILADTFREGIKVYLFSESGSYLGLYAITDSEGKVYFNLPEGENYTFRADLLGGQYWSEALTVTDGGTSGMIATGGGLLSLNLKDNENPLAGIRTYLFAPNGAYLGLSATSDEQGQVNYQVPSGNFFIRADYLGYKFWSEEIQVSDAITAELNIPHQKVTITVAGDMNGDIRPYADTKLYLFTPSGSYLGITQTSDINGQAVFSLPKQEYKIRADYLKTQYWSEPFTWHNNAITIDEGMVRLQVTNLGFGVTNVKTYLFSESDAYLGATAITDQYGEALYRIPADTYSFRADYQGNQYWGEGIVALHQETPLTISTGGADFSLSLTAGIAPLVGVKTYLFSESGSYLGESRTTDNQGLAGYAIADGSYKIRIDYLGYQYWTDVFIVPDSDSLEYDISHREVTLTALGDLNGDQRPFSGSKLYLFTPSGSYQSISKTTDTNGQALFSLPPREYQVRLDHLGHQYWSKTFNQLDTEIILAEGLADITVTSSETPLASISVYLFNESGRYLGQKQITDTGGKVSFRVPEARYKFRADYQNNLFWASDFINGHQDNPIALDTGGGSLTMTVFSGESTILSGVKTYLFSAAGSYLDQSATTDAQGIVSFDVSDGEYKVRVDYLGYQYRFDHRY